MFLRPNAILSAATRVASTQRTRMVVAAPSVMFSRMYASLPKEDVQTRVLDVVKSFDKVDANKVEYFCVYMCVCVCRASCWRK